MKIASSIKRAKKNVNNAKDVVLVLAGIELEYFGAL